MKKIIIIAATIAIALATTACGNQQSSSTGAGDTDQTATVAANDGTLRIAYIEIDSLVAGYDLAKELRTSFEARYNKADREMTAKVSKLEKDMMDAQDKVQKGLVTRAEAAELEASLGRQQQNIMESRDRMTGELAEEESVMNNRIYFGITDFLKEYNADGRYSMILSTSGMNPMVLNADPSMNITREVLAALNARHAEEAKKETSK